MFCGLTKNRSAGWGRRDAGDARGNERPGPGPAPRCHRPQAVCLSSSALCHRDTRDTPPMGSEPGEKALCIFLFVIENKSNPALASSVKWNGTRIQVLQHREIHALSVGQGVQS